MKNIKFSMKVIISIFVALSFVLIANGKNLTVFNVFTALKGYEKEQASDIIRIQKEGIADTSLAIFTLVPEGNPPIDKFVVLGENYKNLRSAIGGKARLGILLQSTIGHGYILKNPNKFEHIVRLGNLKENPYKCCPLGKQTIEYMKHICREVAKLKPDHIMIDDDFRMYTSANNAGCLCPLHLEKISARLGKNITAKQAQKHLYGTTEEDKRIAKIIDEVIVDSLCDLAEQMRKAIDEIDPTIQASVCVCNADIRYAARLGKIFAAKNQEPIIRINNARYAKAGESPRNFAYTMYQSAQQLAPVRNKGIILAETDTLPHNRYGTSARTLHANYIGYIFEHCQGSKQWITSTTTYEPINNEAFRKILSEHANYYEVLAGEMKRVKKYSGFSTLIPDEPYMNMNPFCSRGYGGVNAWAQTLCCVMGIPVNFVRVGENAGMINAQDLKFFSDNEIKRQLSKALAVDGATAVALCKRGYAKFLGVDASFYGEHIINAEIITDDSINGDLAGKQMGGMSNLVKLVPNSKGVRVLSNFISKKFSQADVKTAEIVSPSCTYFENELGGKVVVLGADVGGTGWNTYPRYPRKDFFLNVFNSIEPYRLWYPFDAEVYLKTATIDDGSELVGFFNFGYDPLEKVELRSFEKPKKISVLEKSGDWKDVSFSCEKGLISVDRKAETMYPVVLKVEFEK